MPTDERMTVDERRKYLKLVATRYAKESRTERSALLTEMEAGTGLHRKSLGWRLLRRRGIRYTIPKLRIEHQTAV